jgi:hypothetical protein
MRMQPLNLCTAHSGLVLIRFVTTFCVFRSHARATTHGGRARAMYAQLGYLDVTVRHTSGLLNSFSTE